MKHPPLAAGTAAGFTLVELMVVVVIAAILLSVAVPSYQAQVRKSRRTEARSALMDLAAREERYFSTNNTYSVQQSDLNYGPAAAFTNIPVGSGYYNVTIQTVAPDPTQKPPVQAGYTITATATGPQAADTSCTTFTLDQTGTQKSADNGGATTTSTCWK